MAQNLAKKLSILALSVALSMPVNINLNSAYASGTGSSDEQQLWTAQELLDFTPTLKAEITSRCGDKTEETWSDCWWDLQDGWMRQGGIYQASQMFNQQSFIITAINPSDESIRVVFHDTDYMELEMSGVEIHSPVVESYIVWLDPSYDRSVSYIRHLRDQEEAAGMHVIFDWHDTGQESGWWLADEEITIKAKDLDISQNTTETNGLIYFWVANYPSSILGQANYIDQCLKSDDYRPGMECQIVYDSQGQYRYVPAEVKSEIIEESESSSDTNPEINTEINSDTTISDTSHNDTTNESSNNVDINNKVTNESKNNTTDDANKAGSTSTTAPNTGEATAAQEGSIEFPWWLGVIFISGLATLVWLFWPNRKKSPKKS